MGLEALKEDDSLFVRRSVANHLNDITKDHPELVLQRLEGWDLEREHLGWIAKHACRTLIKRVVIAGRSSHYCPKCQK